MPLPRQIFAILGLASFCFEYSSGETGEGNSSRTVYAETAEAFFPELRKILKELKANAPILLEERQRIKEAQANRIVADSKRGLQISVGANAHSLHENRPSSDYYHRYRFLASAYVRKPLYHWGALRAESQIAELAETSASSIYSDYAENFAANTRSKYLDLVLAAHEIELLKRSLELAESYVNGMEERLRLGLVTELSVSEAKITVLQQQINLAEKERLLTRSKLIFIEDAGYSENLQTLVTKDFDDFAKKHSFTENLPIVPGFPSSPELDNLERAIESENERIKMAKAGLRPKLSLVGGFYQDQVDHLDSRSSQERNNLLVGVEANWALFDSSLSRGQKQAALARKRRFEMQLERETRRLRMEVTSFREHLGTHIRIIESSRQLVAAAFDRFEKSQIEFDGNRITPEVFFSSRLALDQARLSLFRSVANYLDVRGQYERYISSDKRQTDL